MLLTFDVLRAFFHENGVLLYLEAGKKFKVARIKKYYSESVAEHECLYFVSKKYPGQELPKTGVFLFSNDYPDLQSIKNRKRIVLRADAAEDQVFDLLEKCFYKYAAWEQRILACIINKGTLPDLINCCEQMLENPIVVTDSNFHVLASSEMEIASDEEWLFIKTYGYHSSKFINGCLADETFQRCMQNPEAFPYHVQEDMMENSSVHFPIVVNGELVVFISLICVRNIEQRNIDLLVEAAKIIKMAFSEKEALLSPNILENNAVRSFLLRDNVDIVYEDLLKRQLDYSERDRLYVAVFRLEVSQSSNLMLLSRVVDELLQKGCLKNCFVVRIEEAIAIICDQTKNLLARESAFGLSHDFLAYNSILVGIGLYTTDLKQLPFIYEQAKSALDFGGKLNPEQKIYFYESYIGGDLVREVANGDKLQAMIHPALIKLREKQELADLRDTLDAYIWCFFNSEKAAERLHIHRNTTYYRLKKIEELCGVTLDDEATKIHLLLSASILNLRMG